MPTRGDALRQKFMARPDLAECEAKLLDDPTDADTRYGYGMSLSDAGRNDDALETFSQGLCYNPFSPLLYFGRGRKNIAPRRFSQAIADLTMAIRLDPGIYSFWYYRAVANNLGGNYQAAIRDFRHATTLVNPGERYGLIDWLFASYTEMGDKAGAKAVLDEIPDDLPCPQIHYGYKRRVQLYKGILSPDQLIDEADIRARCLPGEARFRLEVATLAFGRYLYYLHTGEEDKMDAALLECLEHPYPGAFGTIKAEDAAKKRGLLL